MEEDSDGKNNLFNEDYEEEEEEKPAPVENDTAQIDNFYAALEAQEEADKQREEASSEIQEEDIVTRPAFNSIKGTAPKYLGNMIAKSHKRRMEQEEIAAKQALRNLKKSEKSDSLTKFVTPAFDLNPYKAYLKAEQQSLIDSGVKLDESILFEDEEDGSSEMKEKISEKEKSKRKMKDSLKGKKSEQPETPSSSLALHLKLSVFGDENEDDRKANWLKRQNDFVEHAQKRHNDEAAVEAARQRYFERMKKKNY